ncbi:MAG TPA: nickel pincer cofactor biosynthesis protein LarC [Candidatus Bathyarchaeia archaeon]|nr:nickel pincer cofactor biosynthesis protein LarC [Candidatus Bathyarchaeia archaeon]
MISVPRPLKQMEDQIGIIDASVSGVSGDKYLGALVDLGGRPEALREVGRVVADVLPGTRKVDVRVDTVERGGVRAKLVIVDAKEEKHGRKGSTIRQATQKAAAKLGLSAWGKSFSLLVIDTLLAAESHVHAHSLGELHLHELGSADTLVDVLGVAYLAEQLSLSGITWWSSPVAVGEGSTRFSGREYPVPPPAVAEIIRRYKYPMQRGHGTGELSTPTGVAITTNLAPHPVSHYPALRPETVGYGAGSRDLDEVANVLRLMIGQAVHATHSHDEIVVLETNLDDVSGEIIGRAIEKLMESGARDVTVTPVYMKKNRPGHIVSVIASKEDAERLADILINETGTFGVREIPVTRHISARTQAVVRVKLKGKNRRVGVKLSKDRDGRVVGGKLEYEDLRRISNQTGLGIREIQKIARPVLESLAE